MADDHPALEVVLWVAGITIVLMVFIIMVARS